jgi:excisionase family DNA binding protein
MPSRAPATRPDPLLTLDEAAARVALSPWTLRRAIARGHLLAYKLGGRIRIPKSALDDWLLSSKLEGPGSPISAKPASLAAASTSNRSTFRELLKKSCH